MMKVLWICIRPLGHYLNYKGKDGSGATWIESIYEYVRKCERIDLSVCFPYEQKEIYKKEILDGIEYYTIKEKGCNKRSNSKSNIETFNTIYEEYRPDIINVWGTEFNILLDAVAAAEKCDLLNCLVLSLQGISQAIYRHYYAGLPFYVIMGQTLRDLLKHDSIFRQRKRYKDNSIRERDIFNKVKYVIGRTDYDYSYSTVINPKLTYFFCKESIREEFQKHQWRYEECVKHRIFVSQGYYPVKGIHFVIEALSMIIDRYPDSELYVAGPDILRVNQKYGRLIESKYAQYIRKLIRKKGLNGKVKYIGYQNVEEMCKMYTNSNVFISASSTENESNSLGEAKMLGMPVIASYVGGVCNRIIHREDGLAYQYDDVVMLAGFICELFDNPDYATFMGETARHNELVLSNCRNNVNDLIGIYNRIHNNCSNKEIIYGE